MLAMSPFGYPSDMLLLTAVYAAWLLATLCFFRAGPWPKKPRTRLVVGNAMVFGAMMGTAFMVGEGYFRFLSIETDSFGMSLPARRWFAIHGATNSLGCRDIEWSPQKNQGVRRVAMVGDSFVYGWGINNRADRITERLSALCSADGGPRHEFMNVAKPGWGTEQQIAPVREMIFRFDVDEVVLGYVFNDIEFLLPVTAEFNPRHPPEPYWFNPETSCFADYLIRRIVYPRLPTVRGFHDWLAEGYENPDIWSAHTDQFRSIIQECRNHNVTIRVVLFPFLGRSGAKFDASIIHAKLRSFLDAEGVPTIDLRETTLKLNVADLIVSRSDAHPNERAHDLFAQATWKGFYSGKQK